MWYILNAGNINKKGSIVMGERIMSLTAKIALAGWAVAAHLNLISSDDFKTASSLAGDAVIKLSFSYGSAPVTYDIRAQYREFLS